MDATGGGRVGWRAQMANIGLDWMGNSVAPTPAAAEPEVDKPADEVEPPPSAPPTNESDAEQSETREEAPPETSAEATETPDPPAPVSAAPGDAPLPEEAPAATSEPDEDDDGIEEVEFVRVPLASAERLKILDRGPKEELERMHAEDRGSMLVEIRVCKALLRQAYPLMTPEELDETLRKHVAKQRAKADPSIDVLRVPLPSITHEAMDDGMARTLLVSARTRLMEHERLMESAAEDADARLDAMAAKVEGYKAHAEAASSAARDEISALRAKLERSNEMAAISSSAKVSSSPSRPKVGDGGANGGSNGGSNAEVRLVVNVFGGDGGSGSSEDLCEALRTAQTELLAVKTERDAANAVAKETGTLASSSADHIEELNARIETLTADLRDATEKAESWQRVANSAKTGAAAKAEATSQDAADRERRLTQKLVGLENDLKVANSKVRRVEQSLAKTKELADKAIEDEREKRESSVSALTADLDAARAERDSIVESLRAELMEARERANDAELRAREAEAASEALRFEMEETLESSYNSPTKRAAELEVERLKKRLVEAEGRVSTLTDEARDARERLATAEQSANEGDNLGEEASPAAAEMNLPTDESSQSFAKIAAERDAYRRRAETAEKKAEAATLLMRPVPVTDELRDMRAAARRGEEAEAKCAGLEAALKDADDAAKNAQVDAHTSAEALRRERSEFELWRTRARGLMEEKDRELDTLRRRLFGGDGAAPEVSRPGGTSTAPIHVMSAEDFAHFKGAMLRFLLAEDWAAQQAMMPVLAALLRLDEDEGVKLAAAREKWEPMDVTLGKQLPESFEQAANSLTDTLGLGKMF